MRAATLVRVVAAGLWVAVRATCWGPRRCGCRHLGAFGAKLMNRDCRGGLI